MESVYVRELHFSHLSEIIFYTIYPTLTLTHQMYPRIECFDSFGLSGFCVPSGSIPTYEDALHRIRIRTVLSFFHIYYISQAVSS